MHKTCPVQIKAAGTEDGLAEGQFKAVVSVFGNVDAYGDVVAPGAFTDTLKAWEESGDHIPVYWSHQMHDPDFNIGWVESAQETDQGLEVLAQLDLEDGASPKARQAYRLLKGRRVTQFSFAYDVEDGGPVEKDGESFNELRRLKLYEVGPTPVGANPATELLAVKQAAQDLVLDVKAGRVLSRKNEDVLRESLAAITDAAKSIKNVLAAVSSSTEEDDASKAAPPTTTTQSEASDGGPVKAEEPHGVKAEEPIRASSVDTWAALIHVTELEGQPL